MSTSCAAPHTTDAVYLCHRRDLVAGSGVVAWYNGHQIALFHLPARPGEADVTDPHENATDRGEALYALDNHDPFSGANVIGRGIIGHVNGEAVVASPIYKQHFRLRDGVCLEDPEKRLTTWPVCLRGDDVLLE
ncbi:nitrite reductase (NAD(P)H) small subunit family protein [Larsenimonas rhizosphaerae]|uniref:Nitrite reductase (NAD(P)H) small subunit family protein n=1 Tax=Larsenimonas rhizosphaerae TaxID=2944682 RepID=A0AA41ZL56_9GAMM|nr:nitrite reductase (NAD(P)H) small subunit family protein [Larsenimonas rhizosphaerae]MCM2129425.1 nitrite reductase (NAD(P)H) small subunit family protein [Larsenimonas rhizosphaerae]MCX2524081.1 nitrite reductase (NAD(P)H) small subunit family protein [Larsenimonas rhizosphaerae]